MADPVLREAIRASQSRMIHRRLRKLIEKLAVRRNILPRSQLGKAVAYALNQWSRLGVYLAEGNGHVGIDNNLAENAIRPSKLGMRNWLSIGNEQSGAKTAILYTVVESCRRLGINTKEYLEDVLPRLPALMASDAVTLTPANWLKARSGKALRKLA